MPADVKQLLQAHGVGPGFYPQILKLDPLRTDLSHPIPRALATATIGGPKFLNLRGAALAMSSESELKYWTKPAPMLDLPGYEETDNHAWNRRGDCDSCHFRARFDCRAAVCASGALNRVGSAT
jgi:hypothetical protein